MLLMGFWRKVFTFNDHVPTADHSLQQVFWDIQANVDYPSLANSVAAVYRARSMTADALASVPVKLSPAMLAPAPNAKQTMAQLVHDTVKSMLDCGDGYWRVKTGGNIQVLLPSYMAVSWTTATRGTRMYAYNNQRIFEGVNMKVLALERGVEDLTGFGPMQSDSISKIVAMEKYIREFYEGDASPTGILRVPRELTGEQSDFARQLWVDQTQTRGPAVLSGGIDWSTEAFSPQESQWVEGHNSATGDIANLFGIPSHLLNHSVMGSSLSYANIGDLNEQWWRMTLFPSFAARIEETLSEIYGTRVFFDPEQFFLQSLSTRSQAASVLVAAGYEPDDVADATGMPPMGHTGVLSNQLQQQENDAPDI